MHLIYNLKQPLIHILTCSVYNYAEATPALGLSLSYKMMEGLLLFKF